MAELERDQALLHAGVAALAALALTVDVGPSLGWRLLLLAGLYHAATLAVAVPGRHWPWVRLWWLATVVGLLLQPVEVAVDRLGLVADAAGPTVIGAPAYLLPLAALPVILVVAVADAVGRRRGEPASWATALLGGVLVLGALDAGLHALGARAHGEVATLLGAALHRLPAAAVLGVGALAAARWSRDAGWLRVVPVAVVVALATAGAELYGWLLVEGGAGAIP